MEQHLLALGLSFEGVFALCTRSPSSSPDLTLSPLGLFPAPSNSLSSLSSQESRLDFPCFDMAFRTVIQLSPAAFPGCWLERAFLAAEPGPDACVSVQDWLAWLRAALPSSSVISDMPASHPPRSLSPHHPNREDEPSSGPGELPASGTKRTVRDRAQARSLGREDGNGEGGVEWDADADAGLAFDAGLAVQKLQALEPLKGPVNWRRLFRLADPALDKARVYDGFESVDFPAFRFALRLRASPAELDSFLLLALFDALDSARSGLVTRRTDDPPFEPSHDDGSGVCGAVYGLGAADGLRRRAGGDFMGITARGCLRGRCSGGKETAFAGADADPAAARVPAGLGWQAGGASPAAVRGAFALRCRCEACYVLCVRVNPQALDGERTAELHAQDLLLFMTAHAVQGGRAQDILARKAVLRALSRESQAHLDRLALRTNVWAQLRGGVPALLAGLCAVSCALAQTAVKDRTEDEELAKPAPALHFSIQFFSQNKQSPRQQTRGGRGLTFEGMRAAFERLSVRLPVFSCFLTTI